MSVPEKVLMRKIKKREKKKLKFLQKKEAEKVENDVNKADVKNEHEIVLVTQESVKDSLKRGIEDGDGTSKRKKKRSKTKSISEESDNEEPAEEPIELEDIDDTKVIGKGEHTEDLGKKCN